MSESEEIWVIKFEDADVDDIVFVGEGTEEAAKETYRVRSYSWNCHLLGPAERIAALEQQLKDEALAFNHANDVVAKLEAELAQAKAEIERLKSESAHDEETLEALWQKFGECPHNHARQDTDSNGICACSFDNKEDVCGYHAPQLKKAIEERDTLRAQVEQMSRPVTDEEWGRYHGWIVNMLEDDDDREPLQYACMNRTELDHFLAARAAKAKEQPK